MYWFIAGVLYAAHHISAPHTFHTYGTFEIDNTISLDLLKGEDSVYVVDGAVCLKVFVRPISFQAEDLHF